MAICQTLRNNKVMNDNKCLILLYIYHLVQGIMLWISQNPFWASLHSHQISNRSNTQFCLLQKIWGISDIPSHSPVPMQYSYTYVHSLSPVEAPIGNSIKHQKNNNHVNSHFSSWCLLLTETGVRISDNTLFITHSKILMIIKKFSNTLYFYIFLHDNSMEKNS